MYSWCMHSATLFSPICLRALTTSTHEAFGVDRSQRSSISDIRRTLPWWSHSIMSSSCFRTPSLIPSSYQLTIVVSSEERFLTFSTSVAFTLDVFGVCIWFVRPEENSFLIACNVVQNIISSHEVGFYLKFQCWKYSDFWESILYSTQTPVYISCNHYVMAELMQTVTFLLI